MEAPRTPHYTAVLHILRYVKGTIFHGLYYRYNSSLELNGYSNADWGGDPITGCSTTGFRFFLGDSLISWRSKKQSLASKLSAESEYRALADTTQELIWLRWLLEDMSVTYSPTTLLYCDSKSVMDVAHNDIFHERTTHIEIDCHFTRQQVTKGMVYLRIVPSATTP
ncbi:secreted RxLR effector protein 161-like [Apium graveolens]|uniref:secreted RxLR effector protein 161-like n=1 Tax=Apium graveolens TaxID=4045 RepID=UPI003D7BBCCA